MQPIAAAQAEPRKRNHRSTRSQQRERVHAPNPVSVGMSARHSDEGGTARVLQHARAQSESERLPRAALPEGGIEPTCGEQSPLAIELGAARRGVDEPPANDHGFDEMRY